MKRKLVSFDWAVKRLLRSKANFVVLEGFLSELLKDDIRIETVLESESNKDRMDGCGSRVDLLVRDGRKRLIIIEVQVERQDDYLQRILFGASKVLVEHLSAGEHYGRIQKVISVSVLYFDLGQGEDYVYHGSTRFTGMHKGDVLRLSDEQREAYGGDLPGELFPEYYLLKVNSFNDIATDGLDQWLYLLKHEEVKAGFKARGLKEAKERLDVLKLPEPERRDYEAWQDDLHQRASMVESTFGRGVRQGRSEGRAEGRAELVHAMRRNGLAPSEIARATGLSAKEVEAILGQN